MIAAPINLASTSSELTDELEQLRELSKSLAQRLAESTKGMLASGIPPAIELLDEVRAYRRRLHGLLRGIDSPVPGCVVAVAKPATSSTASEMTFDELGTRLQNRQHLEGAESLRRQLLQLKHVDLPVFEPLVHCVQEATRLCELVGQPLDQGETAEWELLNQHRPVLNSLLRLADDGHEISDQEWTECYDSIAATYGRQLATALTRGRIRRTNSTAELEIATTAPSNWVSIPNLSPVHLAARPPGSGVPESQTNSQPAEPVTEQTDNSPAAAQNLTHGSVPVTMATTRIELQPLADAAKISSQRSIQHNLSESIFDGPAEHLPISDAPVAASLHGMHVPAVPPAPSAKPQPTPIPARGVTEDAGARAIRMADEIIRLLNEDRLPVALQLTRCLEMRPEPSTRLPPSWLLRALILGRHLSYSKGEIAWQLDNELRSFRPEMLSEGSDDRQLVMGLLLRAAALPAALLAGSTTATGILRAFKITPGFSQLYNYCSRIAFYGDRLDGSLVEMFRPAGTIAATAERENLPGTAREWLQNAATKATSYTRTSPLFLHAHWTLTAGTAMRRAETTQLWCKWQETLLLAQRLLKPVCEGLDSERHWVRQEIARLTSQIRVESFDPAHKTVAPSPSNGRGIVLPVEEMHVLLLEAMAIANRWLRVRHDAEPGEGLPIPLEAIELRGEILQRSSGVIEELVQQRQNAVSPLVKASLACCQAAVRQIESLFELKRLLPVVEPDPLHVLNADLLRIPGLILNEQWQPDSELAVVERELLASLEKGELSWRESFDFHAQAGNHDVTGRLLDLDVWKETGERDALRATRELQITDSRGILATELDDLAAEIALILQAGANSPTDQAAYLQRIEDLRRELPRVLNFGAFRRRVSQLHSTLHRWKNPQPVSANPAAISSIANADLRNLDSLERTAASQLQQLDDAAPFKDSIFDSPDLFPRRGNG